MALKRDGLTKDYLRCGEFNKVKIHLISLKKNLNQRQ